MLVNKFIFSFSVWIFFKFFFMSSCLISLDRIYCVSRNGKSYLWSFALNLIKECFISLVKYNVLVGFLSLSLLCCGKSLFFLVFNYNWMLNFAQIYIEYQTSDPVMTSNFLLSLHMASLVLAFSFHASWYVKVGWVFEILLLFIYYLPLYQSSCHWLCHTS